MFTTNNGLKAVLLIIILSVIALAAAGCGQIEKTTEEFNYETLIGETGTIYELSGGEVFRTFPNSEVIYANSDSEAIFFMDKDGNEHYWQGDLHMEVD